MTNRLKNKNHLANENSNTIISPNIYHTSGFLVKCYPRTQKSQKLSDSTLDSRWEINRLKRQISRQKNSFTSSPARTQLASCAPSFTSSTTTVSLSHLHHFLGNSLTDFVSDDSEAKALLCVYKISGIKKSRYSRPMAGWTKHEAINTETKTELREWNCKNGWSFRTITETFNNQNNDTRICDFFDPFPIKQTLFLKKQCFCRHHVTNSMLYNRKLKKGKEVKKKPTIQ